MRSSLILFAQVALPVLVNAIEWEVAMPTGTMMAQGHLNGWTPKPTPAPMFDLKVRNPFRKRQNFVETCGWVSGDVCKFGQILAYQLEVKWSKVEQY
jgi:hypothetical protein